MPKLLLIDDDTVFCDLLTHVCKDMGVHCDCTGSEILAQTMIRDSGHGILFLDVHKAGPGGLQAVQQLKAGPSDPDVVLVAFPGSGVDAATAIELGAWDYLEKPVSIKYLRELLQRIVTHRHSKRQRRSLGAGISQGRIIGKSRKLMSCLAMVGQASHSSCSVFLHGETGTGKERFARAIHDASDRAGAEFVIVDCTNLPETLVESLLFGHVKGSFTGADTTREGLFKQAHGGTIFFDEVGDLSLDVQKSLLRVLQERRFRAIGAKKEESSDFRVVSASNCNLESLVREGRFRSDLYYRLCTMQVTLPPLRERTGDLPLLIDHYLPSICKDYGQELRPISPDSLKILEGYAWPGNIRELINALYIAVNESIGEAMIYPHHLPLNVRVGSARNRNNNGHSDSTDAQKPLQGELPSLRVFREKYLDQAEQDYLRLLREHSQGSISKACETADITRARLYQLFKKHDFSLK